MLLTDVESWKCLCELGYNWSPSSNALELTMPSYTPLNVDYYTNANDYTSVVGSWSQYVGTAIICSLGNADGLYNPSRGLGATQSAVHIQILVR